MVPCLLLLPSVAQLTGARLSGTKVWLPRGREGEKKLIRQNYGLCKKVEFFPPYVEDSQQHFTKIKKLNLDLPIYLVLEIFKFILAEHIVIESS